MIEIYYIDHTTKILIKYKKEKYILNPLGDKKYSIKKNEISYLSELLPSLVIFYKNTKLTNIKTLHEYSKNDFEHNIIVRVSLLVLREEFKRYLSKCSRFYMKEKNYDFSEFFIWLNNSNKYLYPPKNLLSYHDRIDFLNVAKEVFIDVKNKVQNTDKSFVDKDKNYTPGNQRWVFKHKEKIFNNVHFHIRSKDVRKYLYNRNFFIGLINELEKRIENNSKNIFTSNSSIASLQLLLISLFFIDSFEKIVEKFLQEEIDNFKIISITNIKNYIFSKYKKIVYIFSNNRDGNARNKKHYESKEYKKIVNIIIHKVDVFYLKQKEILDELNRKQIELIKKNKKKVLNHFVLTKNKKVVQEKLDFSQWSNHPSFTVLLKYVEYLMHKKTLVKGYLNSINIFIKFMFKEEGNKHISLEEIDELDVIKFSNLIKSSDFIDGKQYSVPKRSSIYSNVKVFYDFLLMIECIDLNYFQNITFKNVALFKGHYKPIPEEIYNKILEYIGELNIYYKHAFIILSTTGFRWSELVNLTLDSLYKKNDIWYLKAIENKKKSNNLKKGKSLYRHVPIFDTNTLGSINELCEIAKNNNETKIFLKRNTAFVHEKSSLVASSAFIDAINTLIIKYNIIDSNGELWKYHTYQMRVRIATLMAESGYEDIEISNFLNHANTKTINEAYAFVRKKRLAELNTEFFEKHFNALIPKKNLKSLTKKEREEIYIKFQINARPMEYGKCIVPIHEQACGKLQSPKSCACCEYLVTSKEYLKKWNFFYEEQKNRMNKLEELYKKHNIDKEEYSTYAEYKREEYFLVAYNTVIKKIEEEY